MSALPPLTDINRAKTDIGVSMSAFGGKADIISRKADIGALDAFSASPHPAVCVFANA